VSVHSTEELVAAPKIGAVRSTPIATRGSGAFQGAVVLAVKALNDVRLPLKLAQRAVA
jgi:hypothetical protein